MLGAIPAMVFTGRVARGRERVVLGAAAAAIAGLAAAATLTQFTPPAERTRSASGERLGRP